MEIPNVPNVINDPKRKIKITIWAYRKLSDDETRLHALIFTRQNKVKPGYKYDVLTSIQ
jgi:hypothetical protein